MDHWKWFWDIFAGILDSSNDARVLQHSSLYHQAYDGNIFVVNCEQEGIKPYILGDKGYPLLPWLMVPHQVNQHMTDYSWLFLKHCTIDNCVMVGVWWRTLLESWSCLQSCCWRLEPTYAFSTWCCCVFLHAT